MNHQLQKIKKQLFKNSKSVRIRYEIDLIGYGKAIADQNLENSIKKNQFDQLNVGLLESIVKALNDGNSTNQPSGTNNQRKNATEAMENRNDDANNTTTNVTMDGHGQSFDHNAQNDPNIEQHIEIDEPINVGNEPSVSFIPNSTTTPPKNIDKSVYFDNSSYSEKCLICSADLRFLTNHLIKEHPNSEVYLSRPSPEMADRMRKQTSAKSKCDGICGLCKFRVTTKGNWPSHILMHTGEKRFHCNECNRNLDIQSKHTICPKGSVQNIFVANANGHVMVFMCNLCNFVQVKKDNMVRHLKNEHEEDEDTIHDKYQQVTPIIEPNNSDNDSSSKQSPDEETQYAFIDEMNRYKCGIDRCTALYENANRLAAHINTRHQQSNKFVCVHCNETIDLKGRSTSINDLLTHLELHGAELYECLICEQWISDEEKAISHIFHEHATNELKLNYFHREHNKSTISNQIQIRFQCIICDFQLANLDNVKNHYDTLHFDRNINLEVTLLRFSRGNTRRLSIDQIRWHMRQTLVCKLCDQRQFNKTDLLEHCKNVHPAQSIELKLTDIELIRIDKLPPLNLNETFDRLFFCCKYCSNGMQPGELFAEAKDVHAHWMSHHVQKPFQFQVAGLGACHHCDTISTYFHLKCHHADHHRNTDFCITSIANREECALCQFHGGRDEMIEHFEHQHTYSMKFPIFNPICLPNQILNDLLGLHLLEKYRCNHCDHVVDSLPAIECHHTGDHASLESDYVQFIDESIKIKPGCCPNIYIDRDEYTRHVELHEFEFECLICEIKSSDLLGMIKHDIHVHHRGPKGALKKRQRDLHIIIQKLNQLSIVSFGNGLILNENSLLGTQLDDSAALNAFLDEIMKNADKEYEEERKGLMKKDVHIKPSSFIDLTI